MYILQISKKAFVRLGEEGETVIVSVPERATSFEFIGIAMKVAAQVNEDYESNIVKIVPFKSLNTSVSSNL